MRSVFRRIPDDRVHLSVNTKMQVLDQGRGIATVSVSVKDGLRNTTLGRGCTEPGRAARVQGLACTTHNLPLLQAIIDEESEENYTQVLEETCRIWSEERPDAAPFPEIVFQLAKDYSPGLEAARRNVLHNARPNDDYFHLRNKEKEISCRCNHVHIQDGKRVKTNFDWILACLAAMHTMPTAEILSESWAGFMERLRFPGGLGVSVMRIGIRM